MQPKVAVIGGGIGGLGAALSFFRAGFDTHVYEQAHALREVGAGIQVSPNASGVLHGLGRGDPLAKLGVRPFAFHFHSWGDGRFLSRRKRNSWIGPRANILTSKKCVLCETSPVAARATRRKSIFSTHGDRKTF
jgi:2-polyprenyl-6-methoxyphenol hydroxylase-like FAD-dependent oxidoreductase